MKRKHIEDALTLIFLVATYLSIPAGVYLIFGLNFQQFVGVFLVVYGAAEFLSPREALEEEEWELTPVEEPS